MNSEKSKRPWSGFAYLILIILALLVAIYLAWPVGLGVKSVFQILVDAFEHR